MDRSDTENDPEESEISNDGETEKMKKESIHNVNPLRKLDFYEADPFAHCQSDRMY